MMICNYIVSEEADQMESVHDQNKTKQLGRKKKQKSIIYMICMYVCMYVQNESNNYVRVT
jgi:hypothetical protein